MGAYSGGRPTSRAMHLGGGCREECETTRSNMERVGVKAECANTTTTTTKTTPVKSKTTTRSSRDQEMGRGGDTWTWKDVEFIICCYSISLY